MRALGCKYRKFGWHDGGPDHTCTREHRKGYCCEDSWSDYYVCDIAKQELKDGTESDSYTLED